jgi:hypothetical protein
VDQNFNNSQNEFLWTLLANPANDAHLYAYNLQRLVNDFPQSGILRALLAHSSDDKNLKQASAYFNPKSLYKLINAPSSFIGVAEEKIIIGNGIRSNGYYQGTEHLTEVESPVAEQHQNVEHTGNENYFNEHTVIETDTGSPLLPVDHQIAAGENTEQAVSEHKENIAPVGTIDNVLPVAVHAEPAEEHTSIFPEPEPQPANNVNTETPFENKVTDVSEAVQPFTEPVETVKEQAEEPSAITEVPDLVDKTEEKLPAESIEDDTYDEIAGVEDRDIGSAASFLAAADKETNIPYEKPSNTFGRNGIKYDSEVLPDDAEKLILGSIAATDYFMFDNAFGEHKPDEQAENVPQVSSENTPEVKDPLSKETEQQDLSKYHDEKMPYTFMWWLDKTRKEHSGIYQPYAKTEEITLNGNNRAKNATDELQQQYYENIFHITSIEELDKSTAGKVVASQVPPEDSDIKRKEQIIIERFIEEEPQIRPQSSDKLDNENKAKKSSEDRDELVTETLAAIYSEQMLYHKAIASYKKLMLKFPEKSRYFAEKIEQLEKKTN